jgi:competence protein ComEC
MSIRIGALQSSAIHNYQNTTTELILQVTTDPTKIAPKIMGTAFAPTSFSFIAQALEVDNRYSLRIPVRVIAATKSVQGLLPGQ